MPAFTQTLVLALLWSGMFSARYEDTNTLEQGPAVERESTVYEYHVRIVRMGIGDGIYMEPVVLDSQRFAKRDRLDARAQLKTLCVVGGGYAEELATYTVSLSSERESTDNRSIALPDGLADVDLSFAPPDDGLHHLRIDLELSHLGDRLTATNVAEVRTGEAVGLLFPYGPRSQEQQHPTKILAVVVVPSVQKTPRASWSSNERLTLGCGGMVISEPKPIEKYFPICPPSATAEACSATFVFELTIDRQGIPRDARQVAVRDGSDDLAQAARDAIKTWRFIPAISGNRTYEVLLRVEVPVAE